MPMRPCGAAARGRSPWAWQRGAPRARANRQQQRTQMTMERMMIMTGTAMMAIWGEGGPSGRMMRAFYIARGAYQDSRADRQDRAHQV